MVKVVEVVALSALTRKVERLFRGLRQQPIPEVTVVEFLFPVVAGEVVNESHGLPPREVVEGAFDRARLLMQPVGLAVAVVVVPAWLGLRLDELTQQVYGPPVDVGRNDLASRHE